MDARYEMGVQRNTGTATACLTAKESGKGLSSATVHLN